MRIRTRPITYRELIESLNELTPEQLDMTATVLFMQGEEFELLPIYETLLASETPKAIQEDVMDSLDDDVPLMVVPNIE